MTSGCPDFTFRLQTAAGGRLSVTVGQQRFTNRNNRTKPTLQIGFARCFGRNGYFDRIAFADKDDGIIQIFFREGGHGWPFD